MNIIVILTAKYLYILIVLIALFLFYLQKKSVKIKVLFVSFFSAIIALILTVILSHYISDPRPFVVDNIKPLIPHVPDNGFPSDHTIVSMMAASLVFIFNRKAGITLGILAILVGISRVLAHVHHPLDILGGILIAIVSVVSSIYFLQKYKLI